MNHKIRIYGAKEGELLTGDNAIIEIDGKRIDGVTYISFTLSPGGLASLDLSLVGDIQIDGVVDVQEVKDLDPDDEDEVYF